MYLEGMSILEEDPPTRRGVSGSRNPRNSHKLRMPFSNDSASTPRKRGLLLGNLHLDPIADRHLIYHRDKPYPKVQYGNKTLDYRRDASFTEYRQAPAPMSVSSAQSSVRTPTKIGSVAGNTPKQVPPIPDGDVPMASDTIAPPSIEDRLENINLQQSPVTETQTHLEDSASQAKSGRANVRNTISIKPSASKTRNAGKSATAAPDAAAA